MKQISLLGCGWLGLPLAISLRQKGYKLNGSTTSKEKLKTLADAFISPFLVELSSKEISGDILLFLQESDLLIIDIPPGMRSNPEELFSSKMELLIPYIEKSDIKKVLFVSSTSVFADQQGTIDEETIPQPDTQSGKDLFKVEQILQNNPHFNTTIIRFGGLIGPNRHPVKYLAGRKNLKGGNAPVNLIQQQDCIGIIEEIIKKEAWGKVFHGVFPQHPFKKDYYIQKAKKFNLQPPEYSEENNKEYKKVMSKAVTDSLNYQFQRSI
ncbi:SDR family NAD(P)-dependent oxidoreductase [Planktosalinus lacus]|uniref:Epimerase n=1 Tax=Planktosalinus lacus TaxID=1526573 RepID=A0A8J2Y775_9FLAO|nr:SDR family NAD(P)-dependent oxidoreductase [Planktosalinus lacus]GGD94909.1 epimerase [Planktosalinus lacus]